MEEKCRYCGWAYKITDEQENKCDIQSGGERNKTNNQMELLAVIYAMRAIEDKSAEVEIYTDSQYVSENYKNASGMSSNQPYWQMFEEENEKFLISIFCGDLVIILQSERLTAWHRKKQER